MKCVNTSERLFVCLCSDCIYTSTQQQDSWSSLSIENPKKMANNSTKIQTVQISIAMIQWRGEFKSWCGKLQYSNRQLQKSIHVGDYEYSRFQFLLISTNWRIINPKCVLLQEDFRQEKNYPERLEFRGRKANCHFTVLLITSLLPAAGIVTFTNYLSIINKIRNKHCWLTQVLSRLRLASSSPQ